MRKKLHRIVKPTEGMMTSLRRDVTHQVFRFNAAEAGPKLKWNILKEPAVRA